MAPTAPQTVVPRKCPSKYAVLDLLEEVLVLVLDFSRKKIYSVLVLVLDFENSSSLGTRTEYSIEYSSST